MTKPTIKIHNIETDEIVEREMTDTEYAELEKYNDEIQKSKAEQAAKAKTRQAVLDKLGLTPDEVAALLS